MKIQWSALKEKIKMHKLATRPQYSEEKKKAVQRVFSSRRVNYWTGLEKKEKNLKENSLLGVELNILYSHTNRCF